VSAAPGRHPRETGHGEARPPRLGEWLAARVLPEASRDAALGDLHERYLARLRRAGPAAARRWYLRQVLGFLARVPFARARASASDAVRGLFTRSGLAADVRHAARAAVRERGLTAAVVLVLALAIGAAAVVFSIVSAVLLRPLPFPDPEALVMVWDEYPDESGIVDPKPITLAHYEAWRGEVDRFAASGVFESISAVIDAGRWSERVDAALVSASLFSTLGVRPARGRLFTEDDDRPGAPAVAILSDELWRFRFGGDESLIGRAIPIDGVPTQVVGVMPPEFWFYDPYAVRRSYTGAGASSARLWRPMAGRFAAERDYPRYRMVARLRPGVTREAARAAVAAIERRLPLEPSSADGRVRVLALEEQVAGAVRPRLLGTAGAVGLILLVAAINLVSLLAARFDARRTELAVRAALGAGRGRLARALLIHAGLLALAGGAAGLLLARAATPPLLALVPRGLPLSHRVGIDAAVIAFALALSLAIGLAVCLLAIVRLGPAGMAAGLAAGARSVAGRFGGGRMTDALIAAEVGLSLILLISAAVLLRSFVATSRTDAGFDRRSVLTFQSVLMLSAPGAAPDFSFFDRLEARIGELPGVVSAGSASIVPFTRWGGTAVVRIGGEAETAARRVSYRVVSSGYFDSLGIGRLAGRTFGAADRPGAPLVAVVNRAFVGQYLPDGAPAIGQPLAITRGRSDEVEIVGVVADVKEDRLFAPALPIVYVPLAQSPTFMRQFVVRTAAPPERLVESIRQAAAELDRAQPLQDFITLEALIGQSLEEERFYAVVASAFAGIAVLLALAGLYGVVSFAVRQRDREVGVRMALGAGRRAVYRLILWSGMRPVLLGLVAGCLGAAAAARVLRSLIHGTVAVDPVLYLAATAAFAAVAAAACLVPARRAARLDPVRILNQA